MKFSPLCWLASGRVRWQVILSFYERICEVGCCSFLNELLLFFKWALERFDSFPFVLCGAHFVGQGYNWAWRKKNLNPLPPIGWLWGRSLRQIWADLHPSGQLCWSFKSGYSGQRLPCMELSWLSWLSCFSGCPGSLGCPAVFATCSWEVSMSAEGLTQKGA